MRKACMIVLLTLCCGCSLWPRALHPSQMWKMNRQDAWDEGTLSIPDPVDARLTNSAQGGTGRDAVIGVGQP